MVEVWAPPSKAGVAIELVVFGCGGMLEVETCTALVPGESMI